jgi:hypothetical protein
MMNVSFDRRHTDVIYKPAPSTISTAVEQKQTSSRLEYTAHLRDGLLLVWVMVEAIGTRDDVKGSVRKGEPFAISLNCPRATTERPPAV